MIDHIGLKVTSFEKSRAFYAKALEPIGYRAEYDDAKNKAAGFGAKGAIDLWIGEGAPATRAHIALKSATRAAVKEFHAAALKAGGKDNGAPGLRTDYSPTYYAAFVLDPDGNNLEVVCHEPA
ncbi:MAG: VOC family protein [Candidatus Binataceae bacterium]|jgi:catechol 2,3-dioxygenase-like lactoylglutathione lyase family enzyme